MRKIQLLEKIDKLASLIHGKDLIEFNFTEQTIREMRRTLDELTDEYIECYC